MTNKKIQKLALQLKSDLELCIEIEKEYLYYKIFDDTFKSEKITQEEKQSIVEAAIALDED